MITLLVIAVCLLVGVNIGWAIAFVLYRLNRNKSEVPASPPPARRRRTSIARAPRARRAPPPQPTAAADRTPPRTNRYGELEAWPQLSTVPPAVARTPRNRRGRPPPLAMSTPRTNRFGELEDFP